MKAVTVSYFQLQHTIAAPAPVQFQTLAESSRLYEPGYQYNEFVKRLPVPGRELVTGNNARRATGSSSFPFFSFHTDQSVADSSQRLKSLSDSESVESEEDDKRRASKSSPRTLGTGNSISSGDELDGNFDSGYGQEGAIVKDKKAGLLTAVAAVQHAAVKKSISATNLSRAAASHKLKKLKTPSRCRECDSYVYFQGVECQEVSLNTKLLL